MTARTFWFALGFAVIGCGGDDDPASPDAGRVGVDAPDGGAADVGGTSGGAAGSAADAGSAQDASVESEICPSAPDDLPTDITETSISLDGRHITLSGFKHPELDKEVTVEVYLPSNYSESESYPVLYVHDGQTFALPLSNAIDYEVANDHPIEPHIVVGIVSHGDFILDPLTRHEFLSPSPHSEPPLDELAGQVAQGDGGKGQYVDELMVNVIKPYLDSHYATRCGRSNTAVFGYSIGGLMCLYHLLQHPEIFGRGHCSSSSFWWNDGEWVEAWRNYAGPAPVRLWIDVGSMEPADIMRLPAREVRDIGIARGMTFGSDLGYYEEPDGNHETGITRVAIRPWTLWSISDVSVQLQRADATDIELLVEANPADSEFSLPETGESAINIHYPDDYVLTWPNDEAELSSSDDSIATVDETGHVTAVSSGNAYIEVSVNNMTASHLWISPP